MPETLPLNHVNVVELTDGLGESAGRLLADLGATVTRVERSGGSASRRTPPLVGELSISYALNNANKQVRTVDPDESGSPRLLSELVRQADIVVSSLPDGELTELGIDRSEVCGDQPELVWLSLSPFGQTGPYASYRADEYVLYAMSGVLSRSGAPGAPPLLPPRGLVEGSVGVHVVWAVLLAYFRRLRTGHGDRIDVSAFEVMVHGFDPGFGTQGSAAAGRKDDYPRGRPDAANFYPVFRCRDGQVRLCLLAPRQWQAMFRWLGEPEEFADPQYNTIPARFAAADRLNPLIRELFSRYTRQELVDEGAARGIPIGGVADLSDTLATEHFAVSGALIDAEPIPGHRMRMPSGYAVMDGQRIGYRHPAVNVTDRVSTEGSIAEPVDATPVDRLDPSASPLDGLRVLDLGVIVFGAELSRQLADYGADVVKVENTAYPDGLRQSKRGAKIPASVVWGHRNKRSVGIDLRSEEGAELFRNLVREADVVTANFKPGTLARLGFGFSDLTQINERIIVSESSAFGDVGPWRDRQGYGPLIRAATGVSALWRYPDNPDMLCDGSTVYPDHIAGHLSAALVLAALIQREHTGTGSTIQLAQSDVALTQIGVTLASASAVADGTAVTEDATISGVFPCVGDDEWCVVTIADQYSWAALTHLLERSELRDDPRFSTDAARAKNRAEVHALIASWTSVRTPVAAASQLQQAGITAGPMVRLPELPTHPQLVHRNSFTTISHELLGTELPATARAAQFDEVEDPPTRPAPVAGQHTRQVFMEWLGMAETDVDELINQGVLQSGE